MRYLSIFIATLCYFTSYTQPKLVPFIYNTEEICELKTEFADFKSNKASNLKLPTNWTIVNFSFLDIIHPDKFDPFSKKKFLSGLKFDQVFDAQIYHYIIDIDSQKVFYYPFNGEKAKNMKFSMFILSPSNNNLFYAYRLLLKHHKMDKINIFYIDPLDEIFVVINGKKIYVVDEYKIQEATSYLKAKYKTRIEFMKRIGYNVSK